MRVEQQNASLIDTLKQNIGPEEKEGRVTFTEQYFANTGVNNTAGTSESGKSVNVKDATYAKPTGEEKQGVAEEIEKSSAMDATEQKNQMAASGKHNFSRRLCQNGGRWFLAGRYQ